MADRLVNQDDMIVLGTSEVHSAESASLVRMELSGK